MKCDIVRAWKDKAYRQSLSEEQLSTLPANPVGELSDADLAHVSGDGDGSPNSFGEFSNFAGFNSFVNFHKESVAVIVCELNIFSASVIPVLSIAAQTCIKGQ